MSTRCANFADRLDNITARKRQLPTLTFTRYLDF